MSGPLVRIRPKRARPFFARHPWVLASSIAGLEHDPRPGDEVRVTSAEGVFIARGLFNPESRIPVRLYRWEDTPLDAEFWRSRILDALSLRRDLLGSYKPSEACRLIYSEADGLSGLVVDAYDRWLIAQFGSRALWGRRDQIGPFLRELADAEGVILRFDSAMSRSEGVSPSPLPEILGDVPDSPVRFFEDGLEFAVNLGSHQKTGFYLDQRENRRAAAQYAAGRDVLDLYTYTGAFALHAARQGAKSVLAVDSSGPAIEHARLNAQRNGITGVTFLEDDVFRSLQRLRDTGQRFGLVICDPPKFAPSQRDVDRALGAYLRLQRGAIDVLAPGGILVTCSCSGHVDRMSLQGVLAQAGELCGRHVQILEVRSQSADHPISAACPETEYLKCLIAHLP